MPVWTAEVSTMTAIPTWMIGVLAATALTVGGVAVGVAPSDAAAGGADASGHPSADTNGVPPGPPTWLNDSAPQGPPTWLGDGGPPDWLGLPRPEDRPPAP